MIDRNDHLELTRRLLVDLRRHKRELAQYRQPVAIVGMACRFPGGEDLDAFRDMLMAGREAIREIPPDRWPGAPAMPLRFGRDLGPACRWGAFVEHLDAFDAEFFRIAPVEARLLDPQQRMLLETAWCALEDAAIDPAGLHGSRSGVYAGVCTNDYLGLIVDTPESDSLYSATGTSASTALGRIAFTLGFEGPAITVDTACSSSLVAIHQAAAALQRGEADLVLAGGVNVILSPNQAAAFASGGMLAPDGRCKTFDAAANGFVRGEGCGMVVLKRLSDAEAVGDRIRAIIRASAVNQDGASAGLTAPNGPSQERVIAAALEQSGIKPAEVDYLEAHGTGTELGDPIEIEAISAMYGRDRPDDRPLLIGSVKTNVGHLEAAAGVAGLIKTVLAMDERRIPPHLNFSNPNPHIAWDQMAVRVVAEGEAWPATGKRGPRAAVSSFGFSGTNAHVILEGPSQDDRPLAISAGPEIAIPLPDGAVPSADCRTHRLLPLSARSAAAVGELASRYHTWLRQNGPSCATDHLADMAWTASVGRSRFDVRAGIAFDDTDSLVEELDAVARGAREAVAGNGTRVAFLFTGQGSQWVGMGRRLHETEPVVRGMLDRCDALMRELRGESLLEVMFDDPAGALDDTRWTQPALYALECALTAQWRFMGLEPAAVLGHSVGELAASYAAGILSLEDGLRFAARRGELMASVTEVGAMAAVFAPRERVAAAIAAAGDVSIAADNGTHLVISGPSARTHKLAAALSSSGIRTEVLRTSQAFHSSLMEPVLDELEEFAAGLAAASPRLAFVSNLAGRELREVPGGGYWRRQAREEVAFAAGIARLAELGVDALVEVGPQAVLTRIARALWPGESPPCVASVMRPGADGGESGFAVAAAAAWEAGLPLRLEGMFAGERRRRIALPTYPFQRRRHWVDGRSRGRGAADHPLLGTRTELADGGILYETVTAASAPEWLAEHRLFGRLVVPGAYFGALAATAPLAGAVTVEAFQIHSPLILDDESAAKTVQIVLGAPEDKTDRTFEIFSRGGDTSWVLHAEGRVREGADLPESSPPVYGEGAALADASPDIYAMSAEAGLDLGPSFHVIQTAWRGPGEAVSELRLPAGLASAAGLIHPVLLDGMFQTVAVAGETGDELYLPFGWEGLSLRGPLPERLTCHVRLRAPSADGKAGEIGSELQAADIHLYDESGRIVGEVSGYRIKRATPQQLFAALENVDNLLYEIAWKPVAEPGAGLDASFLTAPESIGAEVGGINRWLRQDNIEPEAAADLSEALEVLAGYVALATLKELGWQPDAGTEVALLRTQLRVVESQEARLGRMLELATDTVRTASGDGQQDGAESAPHEMAEALVNRFPFGVAEIRFLQHCGSALADILRGRAEPGRLLPREPDPDVPTLYHESRLIRATNRLLAAAVAAAATSLPSGRTLRLLELGTGGNSAAAEILDAMPPGRVDLTLADTTESGLAYRQNRSGPSGSGGVILDFGRDPVKQGLTAQGYDILVVAELPEAAADIDKFLEHCQRLLAPSGCLILLTDPDEPGWHDLTIGLLNGGKPVIALSSWCEALARAGFEGVTQLPASPEAPGLSGRSAIIVLGPAAPAIPPGAWVIGAAEERLAGELADALALRNQTVIVASPDAMPTTTESPEVIRLCVALERREAWRALFEDLPTATPLAGVVYLGYAPDGGKESRDVPTASLDVTSVALALVQGLEDAGASASLWFATRGGQVVESEPAVGIEGAALWGFARTVALEAPQFGIRLVDLDPEEPTIADRLVQELLSPDRQSAVAWRRGVRRGVRLTRSVDSGARDDAIDLSGTWLITGGLGTLGLETARWLAENGAGTIVLNGRSEPDADQQAVLARLKDRGADLRVVLADVADQAAVDSMLKRIAEEMPPLVSIIHAAGTLRDGALANLSRERLRQVMEAKVRGAWNLHHSTKGMSLRNFLLFSSAAGVLGSGGQANYAAANAFLDQLGRHRRSLGLAGQSIAWGAWSAAGMAAQRQPRMAAEMEAAGVGWIAPRQGRRVLGRVLERQVPSALGIPIEWRRFARGRETEPMLEEVVPLPAIAASAPSPDILARLQAAPAGQREGLLIAFVQEELQAVMHLPEPPPVDTGFFDLGMDSLMAVELRGRLNRALAGVVTLPGSVAFDYPTARGLARHLADAIGLLPALPDRPVAQPVSRPEAEAEDGIAVVGMACRFPGGEDLDAFRQLLMTGKSGVREVPPERRPAMDGMSGEADPSCRWGAFLDGIDLFDAPFFHIAPIEARLLDPQHRLLLETSWLALEDAGIDPSSVRGSRTGVYAGMSGFDYRELIAETADEPHLYAITGVTHSTAIGRIAFALGLEGPAMSIDTACSSSLVSLHLATTALRRGEADMALAGGVNALLAIGATASFADAGMLAPDGRCKTFDAAADGYVRGEGCGMVALKRLADARADGDRIWAVIRGTAVNQDGASAGLTVPNGPAQERVIAEALDQAGINPADVDYLEAHGTGTELGDPIEIGAASAVYGQGRTAERPLVVGSVKTNIGHLEAAAGVAGLVKTVLAMASGTIPRHLNFSNPNPHVDWAALPVRIAAESQAWPDSEGRPRLAAISSFGLSGTNAHVVLEGGQEWDETGDIAGSAVEVPVPDHAAPASEERCERLLPLSGRTEAALGMQARRHAAWLRSADADIGDERLADLAWTVATGRNRFACRSGIVFADAAELQIGLMALAEGRQKGCTGTCSRIGFLFTGQGSQWAGMGRVLYETEPVVRGVLDRCEAVIQELRGESLLEVMFESSSPRLNDTYWTQPALYALACALAAQWQSLGVSPAAIIGHSVGELAASRVAGIFSLEEGLRFAAGRGELMAALPGGGRMAAVFAPRAQIEKAIEAAGDELSIAADNGTHLVVSGPVAGVTDLCAKFTANGRRAALLQTRHAFHSALMDPALNELERMAGEMSVQMPTIPLVSNVSGRELAAAPDGGYWRRHAREEVAFASGVSRLAALDIDCLIEIGPHSVLGPLARASWPGKKKEPPRVVTSLERARDGTAGRGFARAASAAWEAGIAMDLAGLFAGEHRRRISTPVYPFERRRHWVEGPRRRRGATGHPLLGNRTELASGNVIYETRLKAGDAPWLADSGRTDRVAGMGLVQLVLAASARNAFAIDAFRTEAVLFPGNRDRLRTIQVTLGPVDGDLREVVINSREKKAAWLHHARARIRTDVPAEAGLNIRPETIAATLTPALTAPVGEETGTAAAGPFDDAITALWRGPREALAELTAPPEPGPAGTVMHPSVLDGFFGTFATLSDSEDIRFRLLGWERLRLSGPVPERVYCHVRLKEAVNGLSADSAATLTADITLRSPDGRTVGEIAGCRAGPVIGHGAEQVVDDASSLLYEMVWQPCGAAAPLPDRETTDGHPGTWVIAVDQAAEATGLATSLVEQGHTVIIASADIRQHQGATGSEIRILQIGMERREAWCSLFASLQGDAPLRGVLYIASPTTCDPAAEAHRLSSSALALVQGIGDSEAVPISGLWFATHGSQAAGGDVLESGLAGSVLWGFARTLAIEAPHLRPHLVDLDPEEAHATAHLTEELLRADGETAVAWRDGERYVARLIRSGPETGADSISFDGTWLITGGTGALGLEAASWLVGHGARDIVLNARREPDAPKRKAIARLEDQGATVRMEFADIAVSEQVAAMLGRLGESGPPLKGIIHAAGVLSDGALPNLDRDRFAEVMAAKLRGAWNLHCATERMKLPAFVLYSSVAGVLGSGGQANYAAANAFLDQLANWRQARGLSGQSIAWGAWSSDGMAAQRRKRLAAEMQAAGIGWIEPSRGRQALDGIVGRHVASVLVLPIDWARFAQGRQFEPLLDELLPTATSRPDSVSDIVSRLRQTREVGREDVLIAFLQGELQAALHLPEAPPADAGFFELGMDSLTALDFRGRLNQAFAGLVTVPDTVAFDYPDIGRLARHLAGEIGLRVRTPVEQITASRRGTADDDAVAIVGMACRFPGGEGLEAFRDLLMAGRHGIREVPGDRWPGAPAMPDGLVLGDASACRWGAFIDGVDLFDAAFFRIAPVEAKLLDPQQRMLLETSWQALEDAGIDPFGLRGSRTGVFAGMCAYDYRELLADTRDAAKIYSATGTSASTAIGRVAFALGLEGPAMAIDTACSSSLVAVHQAAAALNRGEAELALAGGVNLILSPTMMAALNDAGALAPDGRCKTFDAGADGYVRGEGCGMLVLKRLSEAKRDGNRIWAVIRGSSVNQDGASAGLTVPNGIAQERVIAEALVRSGLEPAEIDYLEAHGTGTELGDPIELGAASAVYGRGRDGDRPLLIGSVKTNIGHLEAAAGVASIIKVATAMAEGSIPRHLNFHIPNPHVDWSSLPIRVVDEGSVWPANGSRPPRAAISSFGVSGTNAHMILEGTNRAETGIDNIVGREVEIPLPDGLVAPDSGRRKRLLALSGRSAQAVGSLAGSYLAQREGNGLALDQMADTAWTAAVGRRRFALRAGLVFEDESELAAGLEALSRGKREPVSGTASKAAFLFAGLGGQWSGMGRELYASEPVVRDVLDRCDATLRDFCGESLLEVMFDPSGTALYNIRWIQPAVYALECALAAQWRFLGVEPAVVLGHSFGELAAAHVAGVYALTDGLRLAAFQGEQMAKLPGDGGMASVFAPRDRVVALVRQAGEELEIAADNATHRVVSGWQPSLRTFLEACDAAGLRAEVLDASHAFHSAQMDPMLDELEQFARTIPMSSPEIPLLSNLTGHAFEGSPDATYWRRHAREEVAFAACATRLASFGVDALIEVSPQPLLTHLAQSVWNGENGQPAVIASMTDPSADGSGESFTEAVGAAWEVGLPLQLEGLFAGERRRRVALPTYPFERQRYWIERGVRRHGPADHPLLGVRTELASGDIVYETEMSTRDPAWLNDHRLFGKPVAQGALYGVLAATAADPPDGVVAVDGLQIHAPLILEVDGTPRTVQVIVGRASEDGTRQVRVHSREGSETSWLLHAESRVSTGDDVPELELAEFPEGDLVTISPREAYAGIASAGLELGPAFQVIKAVRNGAGEALTDMSLPSEDESLGTTVHPVLFDGAFQCFAVAAESEAKGSLYMPVRWEWLRLRQPLPERLFCHARLHDIGKGDPDSDIGPEFLTADIHLYDEDGNRVGEVGGFGAKRSTRMRLFSAFEAVEGLLYEPVWRPIPPAGGVPTADFLLSPLAIAPDRTTETARTPSAKEQGTVEQILARSVKQAVRSLPDERRLSMLEIGEGQTSALNSILDVLPEGRFDYLLTSRDEDALDAVRDRLSGDEIATKVLDLRKDVAGQGFLPHGYDAVIVTDRTDLSRNGEQALANCRRLLAPSGLLFLLAGTAQPGGSDLAEGSQEAAGARGMGWREDLEGAGFSEIAMLAAGTATSGDAFRGVIVARGPDTVEETPGTWIIAAGQVAAAEELAGMLVSRNQTVIIASGDAVPGSSDQSDVLLAQVTPGRREAWHSLFDEVGSRAQIRGVVYLGYPIVVDPEPLEVPPEAVRLSAEALALVQGLEDAGTASSTGIWFVTRGGQVVATEALAGFAESALWGLARTAAMEAPQLGVRLVDLDPVEPDPVGHLIEELLRPDRETAVAWRGGERQGMRLLRHVDAEAEHERFDFGGTWLITGGLGSLGLAVAEWLADRGAGTIVLNGRRKPDGRKRDAVEALRAHGADLRIELADVSDATEVSALLERLAGSLPPVTGIVHAAGILADAAMPNQSRDHIERVMAAKVRGAWNLHRATSGMELSAFVLFSSLAGVLGSGGQLNYAAANAFLDQLARHRQSLGLAGQSIAWGAWSSGGLATEREDRLAADMEAAGVSWITPRQGLLALDQIMRRRIRSSAVALTDWQRFASRHPTPPVILDALLPSAAARIGESAGTTSDLVLRLEQTPEEERRDVLVRFLQDELQEVLHLQEPPPPDVGFFDLGMDSLMAVELRSRINRALAGAWVAPGSVIFEHPDVRSLARHIARELGLSQAVAAPVVELQRPKSVNDERVAIVGMACRFPGAPDIWSFWDLLESGGNAVSRIPGERWCHEELEFAEERTAVAAGWGAFVEDIDRFDAAFFRIPPVEARLIDPQQRMMLETSWQALEDAGLDPASLEGRRGALYGGISTHDYREILLRSGEDIAFFTLALGNDGSSTVGRIAYLLGLEGAAVPINTVCSSALVAVHHAAAALRRQEADLALAGGVNAILTPTITRGYAEVGMLSPTGQNRVFDAGADGYVRSEGCGMFVLKRLADAEADGDRIWAVIRGSSVTQSGSGAGFTAPSAAAQSAAIREALADGGMDPADVDYLEAHGTATDLGDQVELNAAAAVYGAGRAADRPLLVGSVKTNIGHAEAAAGASSLIKVVLSMNRGIIPAHLNLETPNPNLDWGRLPVRVTTEARAWPHFQDRRVRAGVSSFSLTGANAHVIVESHRVGSDVGENTRGSAITVDAPTDEDVTSRESTPSSARILPISATSPEALRELASRYMLRLNVPGTSSILADLAWSAGCGRGHHPFRAGLVFRNSASLAKSLRQLADGQRNIARGNCTRPAFVFAGWQDGSASLDPDVLDCKPLARSMLERCDSIAREELGRPVSDLVRGMSENGTQPDRPSLTLAASYVLEAVWSDIWRNVGLRPVAIYGQGDGRVAAGFTAGLVSLEDGFRIAVARGRLLEAGADGTDASDASLKLGRLLSGLPPKLPVRTLISDISGGALAAGTSPGNEFWELRPAEEDRVTASLNAFARTGVDIVVAIGSGALPWTRNGRDWPGTGENRAPTVIGRPNGSGEPGGFPAAVAAAYESGLGVDFKRLFAGESRRRVSLPPYPFEKRRHWVDRSEREPVRDNAWYSPR